MKVYRAHDDVGVDGGVVESVVKILLRGSACHGRDSCTKVT